SAEVAVVSGAPTAQTLIAEWIDNCDEPPPGRVKGQVAKEVATMLSEQIPYERVRRGLQEWQHRGLHPGTLPSVVHELATPRKRTNTKQAETTAMLTRAMERARIKDAEEATG
ncbi:MAG: hypothetical protein M3445_08255, partial [Actinomycetota bacterium]|nr:hypothetical protein [Actinomycetota bacterium]